MWGRRHQYVNLSFLGIFNFTAPYLPWVLLAFSVVLGSSPVVDLLGMVAGATGRSYASLALFPALLRYVFWSSALRGFEVNGLCQQLRQSCRSEVVRSIR